jgi:hypothetical protein
MSLADDVSCDLENIKVVEQPWEIAGIVKLDDLYIEVERLLSNDIIDNSSMFNWDYREFV